MITYTQLLNGEWIVRLQADNFGAGTLIWDSEPQGCESKARELAVKIRDKLGWGKLTQAQRVNEIIKRNRNDRYVQERKAAMERALRQTKQEKPKTLNNQKLMEIKQIAAPGAENPDRRYIQRAGEYFLVELRTTKGCHAYSFSRKFNTYEEALIWRNKFINIDKWKSANKNSRRLIVKEFRSRYSGFGSIDDKKNDKIVLISSPAPVTPTVSSCPGFWMRLAVRIAAIFRRGNKKSIKQTLNSGNRGKKHPELPIGVNVVKNPQKNGFSATFGVYEPGVSVSLTWQGSTEEEMLRIAWAIIERVGWEWRRGDIEHNRRMVEKVRAIINEYKPKIYGKRH